MKQVLRVFRRAHSLQLAEYPLQYVTSSGFAFSEFPLSGIFLFYHTFQNLSISKISKNNDAV